MARTVWTIFLALVLGNVIQGTPLPENNVLELDDDTFDSALSHGRALLVEFYSPHCQHCRAFAPQYSSLASHLATEGTPVTVARLDVTLNRGTAHRFHIRQVPAFVYFSPYTGTPRWYEGERTEKDLEKFLIEELEHHEHPSLTSLAVPHGLLVQVKNFIKAARELKPTALFGEHLSKIQEVIEGGSVPPASLHTARLLHQLLVECTAQPLPPPTIETKAFQPAPHPPEKVTEVAKEIPIEESPCLIFLRAEKKRLQDATDEASKERLATVDLLIDLFMLPQHDELSPPPPPPAPHEKAPDNEFIGLPGTTVEIPEHTGSTIPITGIPPPLPPPTKRAKETLIDESTLPITNTKSKTKSTKEVLSVKPLEDPLFTTRERELEPLPPLQQTAHPPHHRA